jgi:hypothetical protein
MAFLSPYLLRRVVANLRHNRIEKQNKAREYSKKQQQLKKSGRINIKISVLSKLPASSICRILYTLKKNGDNFTLI